MTRSRSALALATGVVGVIGVLAGVLAVWANRILFDPSSIGGAVEATLADPEVADALGRYVADELIVVLDTEELVAGRVPEDLAGLLVGGVRTVIADGVVRLLAYEDVRAGISLAAEAGYRGVLRVLEDGRLLDGVTPTDGEVRLNLLPLFGRGIETLQANGLLVDADLPDLASLDGPAQQIDALERVIGRPLPDDFGQLLVYSSEDIGDARLALARAQQALVLFRTSVAVIVVATIATLGASLLLAHRRRRAAALLLGGVVVAMGVGRMVVDRVVSDAPTLVLDPGAREAISIVVSSLAAGLVTLLTTAFLAGAVMLGAAVATTRLRRTETEV
jgi:hypothetical protein